MSWNTNVYPVSHTLNNLKAVAHLRSERRDTGRPDVSSSKQEYVMLLTKQFVARDIPEPCPISDIVFSANDLLLFYLKLFSLSLILIDSRCFSPDILQIFSSVSCYSMLFLLILVVPSTPRSLAEETQAREAGPATKSERETKSNSETERLKEFNSETESRLKTGKTTELQSKGIERDAL